MKEHNLPIARAATAISRPLNLCLSLLSRLLGSASDVLHDFLSRLVFDATASISSLSLELWRWDAGLLL